MTIIDPLRNGLAESVAPRNGVSEIVALTMTSEQLAELLELEHNELRKKANAMAAKGLLEFREEISHNPLGGRPRLVMHFDKRNSMVIAAKLNDRLLVAVIDRWIELEALLLQPRELTRLELLLIATDSEQRRITAESERDHAIATKAQISKGREATAMATASTAKRESVKAKQEAAELRDQLGFSARHATVMQVEAAMKCVISWRSLSKWCKANGVTAETVPDKRFPKGVKAWPAGAWLAAYGINLGVLFGGAQ